jgi:hypothetical protein
MSYESDAENADDRFWTRPVLALALVLVVVRAPAILSQPTAAGSPASSKRRMRRSPSSPGERDRRDPVSTA